MRSHYHRSKYWEECFDRRLLWFSLHHLPQNIQLLSSTYFHPREISGEWAICLFSTGPGRWSWEGQLGRTSRYLGRWSTPSLKSWEKTCHWGGPIYTRGWLNYNSFIILLYYMEILRPSFETKLMPSLNISARSLESIFKLSTPECAYPKTTKVGYWNMHYIRKECRLMIHHLNT